MFRLKETELIKHRFLRLKNKLKNTNKYYFIYTSLLWLSFLFFNPIKKYITLWTWKFKKWFWMISYSIFNFFWYKSGYIDDFIVSEKLRWLWAWNKLFENAILKIKEKWSDLIFLFSNSDRKVSHSLYKKFWFTIVSLWFFVIAYKKIKKK